MLGCCGAPAHWAGQQALFQETLDRWLATWNDLKRPQPIVACSSCLQMFTRHLPEADVISLWEVLETAGLPHAAPPPLDGPLAIHDPCTTRDEPDVQAAVRRLLDWA
ncbi:(Fe-S)-binding protein, partial [Desulfosarcina cetonica]|uniref:(Fe-S)-binding protein n=1 Tax=Desulfosarcina cetonica TaxID=90730 RepID=UPI000A9BBC0E